MVRSDGRAIEAIDWGRTEWRVELDSPSTLLLHEPVGDRPSLIAILWRGRRWYVACVLACLAIASVYLVMAPRIYQAEVRLLVLQQGGRPLNVANTDPNPLSWRGLRTTSRPICLIISSPQVVKRAIDKVGLDNLPSLLAAKKRGLDPVEEAINHLKVTRPDRLAKVLLVEYRAGGRDEVVRTIEAITDSYKQFIEETFQKNSSTAISIISKARDDLSQELGELEAKYLELRRKTPALITAARSAARSWPIDWPVGTGRPTRRWSRPSSSRRSWNWAAS